MMFKILIDIEDNKDINRISKYLKKNGVSVIEEFHNKKRKNIRRKQILDYLRKNHYNWFTIKRISKAVSFNVTYKTIYRDLKYLLLCDKIKVIKKSNFDIYSYNYDK